MSSVTRRFFRTEHPELLQMLEDMMLHRAAADGEAKKLAASIGASGVYWKGKKIGGFTFPITPISGYVMVQMEPEKIFYPQASVGTGKELVKQINKLSVPMYDDALLHFGFFRENFIAHSGTKMDRPEISFVQESPVKCAYASVPFFRLGSPESFTPNRSPNVIDDAPVPEGWVEISRREMVEYLETLKEKKSVH